MQTAQTRSAVRAFGFVVMLAAGAMLGTAVQALAESETAIPAAACSAEAISPAAGSEWAVPSTQERRGEPY